jgi:ATP-dependent helicase HrpB
VTGKTTRVPPALVDRGRVMVLQPRRVAVRAVAARIASERGWTVGREVGWHIRFERTFTPDTRLLVVTEGILTARLQQDPLLSDVATIVLDEFHERSIHLDLGLALARQAWLARDDLHILVMSATLDAAPVARYLHDAPVLHVPGTLHPLQVDYAPGESVAQAVAEVLPRTPGQILCFLPGSREIERARQELTSRLPSAVEIVPLHGSLDGAAQDAAVRASPARRVILATNLAETSLTVPGVSAVIDTGLVKVARYDADRGLDALVTERVTLDSADQRAGRAARLGPGMVRRLWDAHDRLRSSREPDINRVDLAGPVLDVLAWGARPQAFEWFVAPPADAVAAALALLRRLGAVTGTNDVVVITELGRRLQRMLVEGAGAPQVAAACALLAEGRHGARTQGGATASTRASTSASTDCDLLGDLDRFAQQLPHVRRLADELTRLARGLGPAVPATTRQTSDDTPEVTPEETLRRALFAGYADRLGRRRSGTAGTVLLASGHGAALGRESGVRDGEFLVALDVTAAARDGVAEARIHMASRVEPEWITPTHVVVEHRLDAASGRVKAARVARYDAITLSSTPVAAEPDVAAGLLADAWLAREPGEADAELLRRLRFAGLEVDLSALVRGAAASAASLDALNLAAHLPFDVRRRLDTHAPASLPVPSGRSAPLTYNDDGTVTASVKLQELFGLADTPTLGPHVVPVTFSLLAPNGRPVQTTRDLRSFWQRTYPEVRKELRGRYPRHPWPDDPWTATATHRTTRGLAKSGPAR